MPAHLQTERKFTFRTFQKDEHVSCIEIVLGEQHVSPKDNLDALGALPNSASNHRSGIATTIADATIAVATYTLSFPKEIHYGF